MASADRQDPGRGGLSATPLPAHDCPVCGGPNGCAPARSGRFETPCWCTALRIAPERLVAVPADQRGRACLCPRCAGVSPADAAAPA